MLSCMVRCKDFTICAWGKGKNEVKWGVVCAVIAQLAERVLGKNEVLGSTPNDGSLIQLSLVAEMVEWSNTRVCKTRGASLRRFEPCSRHHKRISPSWGNFFMIWKGSSDGAKHVTILASRVPKKTTAEFY
ncbi:MAG: hypothetical protein UW42_C0024G0009 [Candidatus Collierbacteria bacterium GW2011_GWB1_44_197]|nr:MAG: hypothetical protein UW42_C0024G0009 [Candidatus Collierbacteria bacterium GW2011_GWB1_44_197]